MSPAIDLLFAGMEKLSPGDNASTLYVLDLLPRQDFRVVVDAGCGTGRQTLALAKRLGTLVHAVDSYQPFLNDLARRAADAHVGHLVQPHCIDMNDIPQFFPRIDLLWCEGAAYNIGFANALATWKHCLTTDSFAVISELSWLKTSAPNEAVEYFRTAYPDMRSVEQNVTVAQAAGYEVLQTYTLPPASWTDGYYDVLLPRARSLLTHADAAAQSLAAETIREIDVFDRSDGSYGYVFYVLRRA